MYRKKICPECETEYLPTVEKCSDCGAVLLSEEEYKIAREQKNRFPQKLEDTVVIREGDLSWISELHKVLIAAGIPCAISSDSGCNRGCCGDTCRLMVSPDHFEKAQMEIEEYFMELHPEARVSKELVGRGRCPACGAPVTGDRSECPDCGLLFIIEEEE